MLEVTQGDDYFTSYPSTQYRSTMKYQELSYSATFFLISRFLHYYQKNLRNLRMDSKDVFLSSINKCESFEKILIRTTTEQQIPILFKQ